MLALCAAYPAMAQTLPTVTVNASADASAQGLSPVYPGGQVARGGRAGILGTKDNQDTPFSITSYTNELIQDRLARSVGDVLQNDPTVRVARGFGNFQESYFIRGFILGSDDVAYNGMYGLLPRQYIGTELFERVEVLRGASAFLNGANPGGGGIGGAINLLPKRAPNEPLSRVSVDLGSGANTKLSADIARRFGPDQATGIRLNASAREGGSGVDHEKSSLSVLALGLDWRSRDLRLSADLGWHDNQLQRTRSNVTLVGVTSVPDAPSNTVNFAQPWSYSNERDTFGTVRAEYDINPNITAWAALGARRGEEANTLANLNVTSASTGAGNTSRFDNTGVETVKTAELGVRGKLRTGPVGHEWVVSASHYDKERSNAYAWDFFNTQSTNLYSPVYLNTQPAFTGAAFRGNSLDAPALTAQTRLASLAVGDTLSFAGDTVLLTLGARNQTLDYNNYDYNTGVRSSDYKQSRTSPVLGLVYKASQALSVYGNYVEGLSQGEAAPANSSNPGEKLAPYVSKQQEVGVKYDAGRFSGALAAFSTTRPRALVNAANIFTSEGKDRHQGLELTLHGEATRSLRLLGGATWLEAQQQSTGSATTDGKRVIGVPSFQANVGVEWDVTGVPGLALDGRIVHTGASFADASNTLEVPGWTRLDVGARYLTEVRGRLVTLRARIDNVSNQNYWASVGGYSGAGYLVVGAPRTFSLSASVDF
ncbi:TonB-dependent receptor [Rhodoferax ferrireducens]|uniref:TonB-dependent receptor n=1 Tax=Rhodoferax ferrireducens TaxID=192843 RepID=UPI000E0D5406|nr:TonB-dependent receptor [Rhodoferax ferrireducens]